jgi:hypothetical protein
MLASCVEDGSCGAPGDGGRNTLAVGQPVRVGKRRAPFDSKARVFVMARGKASAGCLAVVLAAVALVALAPGAATAETKRISFATGASSATAKGTIKGDRFVDYVLRAGAGQTMSVTMKTSNGANYFNVLPPGSHDVAIFVGSTSGNEWTGVLPAAGDYTIRVYLMRSAARRNESASYTLTVGVTGAATAAALGAAPKGDAKVKGTPYHAVGPVPCSMGDAPPGSTQCEFGVIRGGRGNADVHITPPGGFERVLRFRGATVTTDGDAKVKSSRSGDDWLIDVNDYEHYRIPDAVISGG